MKSFFLMLPLQPAGRNELMGDYLKSSTFQSKCQIILHTLSVSAWQYHF